MRRRDGLGGQTMVPAALLLEENSSGSLGIGFVLAVPLMLGIHIVQCCLDRPRRNRRNPAYVTRRCSNSPGRW